jgi:hypothetical protein
MPALTRRHCQPHEWWPAMQQQPSVTSPPLYNKHILQRSTTGTASGMQHAHYYQVPCCCLQLEVVPQCTGGSCGAGSMLLLQPHRLPAPSLTALGLYVPLSACTAVLIPVTHT